MASVETSETKGSHFKTVENNLRCNPSQRSGLICFSARPGFNIARFFRGSSMRVLFALLPIISPVSALAQDTCGFLHRQTQAFSDAGQRGNGATMEKMLDPNVIFFNETGDKATRADMAGAVPPPAGTPIRSITTTDWDCRVYGDAAVTSFIDVLDQGSRGEMQFRSVETWKKQARSWRMIGSETLTLPQDPDPVVLDGKTLEQYVGNYESGANMQFTFARRGDELVASLNGNAGTVQKAQARDVFFSPAHGATPKVFLRDDEGKITGFIYLRGKNSIVFKRAG
jgi:hypothetical protein